MHKATRSMGLRDAGRIDDRSVEPGARNTEDRASVFNASEIFSDILALAVGAALPQAGRVPSLRALVLGFLGRHVDSLVAQMGPDLCHLPTDIKACLLCVARRRGVLSNRVLLALADEGWTLMDVSGASALTERALRNTLVRCPRLRALDLSGLTCPSPALFRDLPALCPSLELLAVGGGGGQQAALLEVLPDLLPHMRVRQQLSNAVKDSWEDTVQGDGTSLPDPGRPCGLQRLKLLVWPHAPPLVRHVVRTVNPRVIVLDALPAHAQSSYGNDVGYRASGDPWLLPPAPMAAMAAAGPVVGRCAGDGSPAPAAAPAAHVSGRSREAPSVSASTSGPPRAAIQVIRVHEPEREREPVGSGGASSSSSAAAGNISARPPPQSEGRTGTAGGAAAGEAAAAGRVGRYTAPHLRQQQQQRPQPQPVVAAAAELGAGAAPAALLRQNPGEEAAPAGLGWRSPGVGLPGLGFPALQMAGPTSPPPLLQPPQLPHVQLHDRKPQHQQQQQGRVESGRPQLDDCLAALVSGEAWEGLGGGSGGAGEEEEELHIAEKFRRAYDEQDARLRAKAAKEAAAAERYELRTSGAARALAQWLDGE